METSVGELLWHDAWQCRSCEKICFVVQPDSPDPSDEPRCDDVIVALVLGS